MNANSEAAKTGHEAEHVKTEAAHAAKDMGGSVKEQAHAVAAETKGQAKSLASSLSDEVSAQTSTQQSRLAEQSRTVSDDLQRISRGERPESEMVNQLVSQAADRAQRLTHQLETKEPRELLGDVRRFASRRPGLFLAIAAGLGIAAGRLTRGFTDSDDSVGSHDSTADTGTRTRFEPTSDYGGESAPIVDPTLAEAPRPDPGSVGTGSRVEPTSDYGGEPRPGDEILGTGDRGRSA